MRVLKDFERFFMNMFDSIAKENIDFLEIAMNIAMLPVFQLEKYNNAFLKKTETYTKMLSNDTPLDQKGYPMLHRLVHILAVYFNFWLVKGRLPAKNNDIYELIYTYMIQDLNRTSNYTFEEVKTKIGTHHDAFSPEVDPKTKFILDSLRKGIHLKEVKFLVEEMIKEEMTPDYPDHPKDLPPCLNVIEAFIEHNVQAESETSKRYKKDVTYFFKDSNNEAISKAMFANYWPETDSIWFDKDNVISLQSLIYTFGRLYKETFKNQEKLESLNKKIAEYESSFKSQVLILEGFNEALEEANTYLSMENEVLKNKIKPAQKQVDFSDAQQVKVDELTADLDRVTEERNHLYEMIENLSKNVEKVFSYEEKEPILSSARIAYFGPSNPSLRNILSSKGIKLEEYSAVEIPNKVPDIPIFFNVDVASHKVWNIIKNNKPITVSGSNPKILSNQIIKHLNRLKEK